MELFRTPTGRRLFWSTQPGTDCPTARVCGATCDTPGLLLESDETGVTISTDNWVRGLALNMLMTSGRLPDRTCGYAPRALGGHWSESFDQGAAPGVGSLVLNTDATNSVDETLNLIVAFAQATLDRLIARGVAVRVDVTGEYIGGNRFSIGADITGLGNNSARVGVTGERLQNGWVWE